MECHSTGEALKGDKIIIVGNPNVGKSVIFGLLTGRYVTVSNYPGTTVEISQGYAQYNGKQMVVIDTPGTNNLIPMSEDEKITRDILMKERPKAVVQVADMKNLQRSLMLTLQLAEMGLPMILDLNMVDEAKSCGITVNLEAFSEILGVEVVPTVATRRQGIDRLKKSIGEPKSSHWSIEYPPELAKAASKIEDFITAPTKISKKAIALMLLAGDESLKMWLHSNLEEQQIREIEKIRAETQKLYKEPLSYIITRHRLGEAGKVCQSVSETEREIEHGAWAKLSSLTTHPIGGIPILLAIMYLIYKFVGEFGAGTSVDFLEEVIFGKYLIPWFSQLVNWLIPFKLVKDLIIGEYGLFTMALTYAIAIVLPIVGYFFLVFGMLEDSGYLPRLAVMVNRIFKIMGLNGKAVLPMVLGLGCDTMATMTARILDGKKEKIIVTLLLALGVPCSAQLGVVIGMLSGLSLKASIIWVVTVVMVIFIVGFLASRVLPGEPEDFILELPPLRIPQIKNIVVKTLARIEWYLKEAVPLFILGTLILFLLDKFGLLALIEKAATPVVVDFLGLPAKATSAFIIGFLRRDYGAAGLFVLARDGQLNPIQILVSLVTMTLFVPCIANFFMIIKERGIKIALATIGFIFPFAFLVGGLFRLILEALKVNL